MSEYLYNLTDHIIRKNHYDEWWECEPDSDKDFLLDQVEKGLLLNDLRHMRAETLGKIIGSFDAEMLRMAIGWRVQRFPVHNDGTETLRALAAQFLSLLISHRLDPEMDGSTAGIRLYVRNRHTTV